MLNLIIVCSMNVPTIMVDLQTLHFCFLSDCADLRYKGHESSGIYTISFDNLPATTVYCDQQTDGGGWLVSLVEIFVQIGLWSIRVHHVDLPYST